MNYERYYNDIINNAKNREKPNEYTELHHIIPKSLGGSNDKTNLVALTAKEHYIVHHLLYKIYKDGNNTGSSLKMALAWMCMSTLINESTHIRYKISAIEFEKSRKAVSEERKDKTVYTAIHRSGNTISGTRDELAFKMNKNHRYDIAALFDGTTCYNYTLKENYYDDFLWDVYTITNGINTYKGYYFELCKIINVTPTRILSLKEDCSTTNGYWLINLNGFKFITRNSTRFIKASEYQNNEYTVTNGIDIVSGNYECIKLTTNIEYSSFKNLIWKIVDISNGWWITHINGIKHTHKSPEFIISYIRRYVTLHMWYNGSEIISRTSETHSKTTGMNIENCDYMVLGKTDTSSGWWFIPTGSYIDGKFYMNFKDKNNKTLFDSITKQTKWVHSEFGIVSGTMKEIIELYSLESSTLYRVFRGMHETSKGWKLIEIDGVEYKFNKPNYDISKTKVKARIENNTVKRIFNHTAYGKEELTVNEMIQKYKEKGFTDIGLKQIVKPGNGYYKGWTYLGDVINKP